MRTIRAWGSFARRILPCAILGSVRSWRNRVRPVTFSPPSFFRTALPMTSNVISERDRLLVLAEHVLHRLRDLAEARVRLHGVGDRRHEVRRPARLVAEPGQ